MNLNELKNSISEHYLQGSSLLSACWHPIPLPVTGTTNNLPCGRQTHTQFVS